MATSGLSGQGQVIQINRILEARGEIESPIKVLQTSPLSHQLPNEPRTYTSAVPVSVPVSGNSKSEEWLIHLGQADAIKESVLELLDRRWGAQ